MKSRKFSIDNSDKKVNTIIEIRKEILIELHNLCEDIDDEKYGVRGKVLARQEIKSIAEMVRDKDKLMKRAGSLYKISQRDRKKVDPFIKTIRLSAISALKHKKESIVATQYDTEELEIVYRELDESETLILEKDRLIDVREKGTSEKEQGRKQNPFISKYFKIEENPTQRN